MTDEPATTGDQKRHYFVDEAGDPVLFNRRKQIVVGQEGCSSFFILGLLDVAAPEALGAELVLPMGTKHFMGMRHGGQPPAREVIAKAVKGSDQPKH